MFPSSSLENGSKRRIPLSTFSSFFERNTPTIITSITTSCALTVATAAPATSILGNGPTPKIKRGSNNRLMSSPIKFATNGVLESPCAVYNPVSVRFKKENRIRPQVMRIYIFASRIVFTPSNLKNPTSGSVNNRLTAAKASPKRIESCTAVLAYRCACSLSPRPRHCATCTCPPIRASEASPCDSQTYMPPTPTAATALEPNSPIHAISVIL